MNFTMTSPCALEIVSAQRQEVPSSPSGTARLIQARAGTIRTVVCQTWEKATSGGEHPDRPPKLEPFSQSRLSRSMRERSFLQKTEDALYDKCMALEGEAAYECWEALSEYEGIKDEAEKICNSAQPHDRENACRPLVRLENMVRQSGGVNSLIENVLMISKIKQVHNSKKLTIPEENEWLKGASEAESSTEELEEMRERHPEFLVDGGIPKTEKELKDERDALMPDSPFTRLLKIIAHHHAQEGDFTGA